jgi:hypothetical protein
MGVTGAERANVSPLLRRAFVISICALKSAYRRPAGLKLEFSIMAQQSPKQRIAFAGLALALGCAIFSQSAVADQNCNEDIQKLAQRREAELAKINNLVKVSQGKKLDPAVFCSQSAGLGSVENALIAYMVKNKDWCSIPDDAINNLKEAHAKSAAFSSKACTVASQMRKMKEQEASGGAGAAGPQAQPLPTGPL